MCCDSGGGGSAPETPPEIRELYKSLQQISEDQYNYAKEKYRPLEDKLVKQAERYQTPEYAQEQADFAQADVAKAYADAKMTSDQNMKSMGINVGDPRYAAANRGMGIAEAGATAGAGTLARKNAELQGFNTLAGIAGRGDAKVGMAVNAAQAGGSMANQAYGNELNAWNTTTQNKNANSAGIGQLLGTGAGLLMMSSKKVKTDKRPVKGALKAVENMPVESWRYKGGIGRHVGPYAEDFKKETGAGDGKTINVIDAIGTNMAAIKELSAKVDQLAQRA
jgi:hypothetical protein